jgi:hypothetical protein
MNPNTVLSPAVVHAVAIMIVGTSVLMVAAHAGILALAGSRTELSPSKKLGVPLLAAVLFAVWLAWAVLAVGDRVAAPEPAPLAGHLVQQPSLLLDMAGFVALGIAALFASRAVREVNKATPPAWLIAVQAYRVEGALFLWPMLAAGALPAGFALPAGIGDVATGMAAPFVALAVARNRPGARARAVAWNLFGILDLVVATTMAVLTHSTNIARFPIVVVPLFLGPPIGILTHIYSLRNLRVNRGGGEPASG